jgi:hypothetical protein
LTSILNKSISALSMRYRFISRRWTRKNLLRNSIDEQWSTCPYIIIYSLFMFN